MASSYTSLLGLVLPVQGELSGSWGDVVNAQLTNLLDTAIAGATTVTADTTLTSTDGAANQARSAIIIASPASANITITAPARSKLYTIINTSATYTVKIVGAGPTTGVTLGVSEKAQVAWNGSDFVRIGASGGPGIFSAITNTGLTSGRVVYSTTGGLETDSANLTFNGTTLTANTLNLTNALGTTYGGTGLSSFTSGGVVYASSTSALTTGSALTFDGSTLETYSTVTARAASGTSALRLRNTTSDYQWQTVAGTNAVVLYDNAVGSGRVTVDSSGNLGIGTSSPTAKLQVTNTLAVTNTSGTQYLLMGNQDSAGTNKPVVVLSANANLAFGVGNSWASASGGTFTEYMRLDSSGNLGLGVTPSAWSSYKAFDISSVGSVASVSGQMSVFNNAYWNGTNHIYKTTNYATYYNQNAGTHAWYNAPSGTAGNAISFTQAMTLDASGNLLVGGTATALGKVSVQGTGNYDAISAETSSSTAADTSTFTFRKTGTPSGTNTSTTGNIVFSDKYNNGTQADTAKVYVTNLTSTTVPADSAASLYLATYSVAAGATPVSAFQIGGQNGSANFYWRGWNGSSYGFVATLSTSSFGPGVDNTQALGGSSFRWTTVYATTGTINTSDRNDKQDIEELSAAEQRVAVRVKGLIRKFRFKDSVAAKGDNARLHFGVIAQDVQDAFTAEGLDATQYGLFCSDTFKAIDGKPVEVDPLTKEYPEGAVDYIRLGVRYDELLAFVISAI
jgi:hypothetical protein